MIFDSNIHKCTIIINKELSYGLAANAATVVGVSLGKLVQGFVGTDLQNKDGQIYPGIVYSPVPILISDGSTLSDIHSSISNKDNYTVIPFSSLAQSCKTYKEYEEKLSYSLSSDIKLAALGMVGPKKEINKLTGALQLLS